MTDNSQTETINWENGVYKGEVSNNKPHGRGVMTHASGNKYTGTWDNGMRHGEGYRILINGQTTKCKYDKDNCKSEYLFIGCNGEIYEGEPLNGSFSLYTGKITYKNNNIYEGCYFHITRKLIVRTQYGKIKYANGDTYTGDWSLNKYHGHGVYFNNKFKITYEGNWVNGKKVGLFVITDVSISKEIKNQNAKNRSIELKNIKYQNF